ncbi:SAM-dependent methyltransferase [Chitinophagales bacterium]|nr:SAM-dependent methyltransferase [Chitinophagales bacterium]
MLHHFESISQSISSSIEANSFVKISLANYNGNEEELKRILIRKTLIKRQEKFSFTYKFKTKDTVKNYSIEEGVSIIEGLVSFSGFRLLTLYTLEFDLRLEALKEKKWKLKKVKPAITTLPSVEHDRKKNRKIASVGKKYLQELKITDKEGKVYKATQDKYRQINNYVEILSSLLKKLPKREITKVVDMGAGKGYLTFALYDYLNNVLKNSTEVIGVEYRKDLVELCNKIAKQSGFSGLGFIQGEIGNYEDNDINVLIALHACDTATDDAIFKGIKSNADLIVVAPCCHKQVRREMEKHKVKNDLDFLVKHGIFLERQAEMVTDGIRALILEYFGYSTKVMEFISDAHTPKNILVIGSKSKAAVNNKEEILNKIKTTKAYFGLEYHHLERLMDLE